MLSVFAGLLVRSGLILGAAELCRRSGRRAAPSYRHRIVFAGFVLLLIWPVFSAVIPEIDISLWRSHAGLATVTVEQTIDSLPRASTSSSGFDKWPVAIWLAGVMISLLPVIVGHIRVRLLVARTTPFSADHWPDVAAVLPVLPKTQPELRMYPGAIVPFVFGLQHPQIVVPADWADWSVSRRRAVLLHELAHIQRRDIASQLLANVVTALWWFQPLCWLNRSSLRRESERACDALVLRSGVRASEYASELLAVAKTFTENRLTSSAAIAMAGRGDLQHRLYAILDPQHAAATRRPVAALVALVILTVTASAVTPIPESNAPGGKFMNRSLFSGLLAAAGLSAATIGGSVLDPSGAAVPDAQASLYNPDTSQRQQTSTSLDGKFTFQSLDAGSYILHVQKPGFASLYREFNVQDNSDVQHALILSASTSTGAPTQPIHVNSDIAENNLIRKVQPLYPATAKQNRIQGKVLLQATISKEGVPEDIQVVSSPSDDLTQSALDAVRQWRYRPTLLNGQPVAITTDITVNYTLMP